MAEREKMTVTLYPYRGPVSTWPRPRTEEAVEMSQEEFDRIKMTRDTPSFVVIRETGEGMWNSHTCLSSWIFGGTCNCISHPAKKWYRFNPETGAVEWDDERR